MPFTLSPEPDDVLSRGQLITVPNTETNPGSETTISDMLLSDDGAFTFESHDEMCNFLSVVKESFAELGLLMHVGTVDGNGKHVKSKTEAVHCPARLTAITKEQLVLEKQHTLVKEIAATSTAPMNSSTLVACLFPPFQMNETSKCRCNKQQHKPDSLRTSGAHLKTCGSSVPSFWQFLRTLHCVDVNAGP